ncbi:MAG: M50 family metallopeptidase [Polyangiales bacterium]
MDSILYLVVAVLGLSTLIIIHEFGHFIVARAFGMRARVFSVGFGPTVAQWRPKGGETVYQIAAIPVLAYVNIAGMDPREPSDPHDRGSYKNGSLLARLFVIAGGPLANYFAAMAIAFALLTFGGDPMLEPRIREVLHNSPAAAAGLRAGDRIVRVDNADIARWAQLVERVSHSGGRTLPFVVERDGRRVELAVTPRLDPASHDYKAGVIATLVYAPIPIREAALRATVMPARFVVLQATMLRRWIQGQEKGRMMGAVGIVNEMAHEARRGWRDFVQMLWVISVGLFFLNLLPIPALDGGRAVFLGYEMLLRRKLPPRFEYAAVAVSMVLLLGVAAVYLVVDVGNWRW